MSYIRFFFEVNEPVILFGYALAFFAMGLAIAVQSRSSSRLSLARSLAWLAAFGITHSLFEWGELFSPVHEAYLTPAGIEVLHVVHLLFLSISFVCLFEFGVALLQPLGRGHWLHHVTLVIFALYVVGVLIVMPRVLPDPHTWHAVANATARYFIGFPGGLLAAYGLREQTFRHIAPLDAPKIVATLRISGIALFLYAIFGGLIPPPVPFFPGNLINVHTFEQMLGVPPLVFQSVIGLTLAIATIRALEVFEVEMEHRVEHMEQRQILVTERERIGRELHDSTIQAAYTAGLLIDSARKLADPESQVASRLEKALGALNDVIHDLRRNLGALRTPPSVEPLPSMLRRLAEDPRFRSLVDVNLKLEIAQPEQISPVCSDHILAIVNEALANVVRHAHARQVWVVAQQADGRLKLQVADDGVGFSKSYRSGFGLRNMQDRARMLGGQLVIAGEKGRGTRISLDVPLEDECLPEGEIDWNYDEKNTSAAG